MPYVGTGLVGNFASTFRDEFTGDGSNTNFTLSRNAHHENDLEVFVGNVRQQPGDAYTVSGTTLAFTGTPANGEVIYVVHQAGALQTVQAPTDHGARDFNITGDANKITFGDDSEITMTHVADSGLALKNTNTGDDKPFTLVLQTGETDIAANDKLGVINFQAPDEGTGTDAILVAAGIEAVSEGDFSSSSNATKLSFKTASSAAAAETMSLSSGGNLIVSGNVSVGGDLDVTGSFDMSDANITNVGSIALDSISGDADSNTSITFSGSDVITFATGGSTAFTANADQTVTFSAAVSGTSADFDGGVTIDNITIDGTEIDLSSGDLTVDVAGDIILDADGGEVLFHDATTAIGHVSMDSSNLTIKSLVSDKDIIFQGNDGGSGITALTLDMSASGAATFNSSVTLGGGLVIPDGGDIGSASDLNAIGISSGGVISITATTANTNASDGALTVAGGVGIAADLSVGDDLRLISDSAVLSFGADNDITLTHNADTGLTLNGKLVATELDISGNIDVDGTTNLDVVDIDGAVDMASTLGVAGVVTANAGVVVDNITIDGTEIDLSSGDLTLDVAGDIILDADGADIIFKDGGTDFGRIKQSSSDLIIRAGIQDKDIKLQGNDGGSAITALTLDMSEAGNATFNNDCKAPRIIGNAIIESSSGFSSDTFAGMFLNTSNASDKHGIVCASKHADSNALLVGQHDTAFSSFIVKGDGEIQIATQATQNNSLVTINDASSHVGKNGITFCTSSTGTAFSHALFLNPNGNVGSITTNGSATTFATSSDYRLKENVTTSWDATSRLKQLKPSRFNFIADKDTIVDGFLAHEVQSVVPEAITGEKDATQDLGTITDEEGNIVKELVLESSKKEGETWTKTKTENVYQGIDQAKLVPLLTKALQEQQATIEALTARIVTLENA